MSSRDQTVTVQFLEHLLQKKNINNTAKNITHCANISYKDQMGNRYGKI